MLFLITIFIMVGGQIGGEKQPYYVVPVEGEVGPAMTAFVTQSIKEAEENNAKAIIFKINTPGGLVDSALSISEAILKTPIKTIAFVDGEAISAGTIITISAEDIYMSPSSTIGAAETRPKEEKYISYWAGKLRNVAQLRDRDPKIIAAMADADIEIEGIIEKGKLLTLTSQEAMDFEIIDGIVESISEIERVANLQDFNKQELSPSFQLLLSSLVTNTAATSILLSIGFIGAVVEIFTPGFGLGGVVSLTAFGLFFGGLLLAGHSSWLVILIFFIGIILLLVEVLIPGFGIPGILGISAIIASIVLASSSIEQALISIVIAIVLTIIAFILLFRFAPRNKFFKKITLSTSLKTSDGYMSSKSYKSYINKIGLTITPLRPSGSIEIEDTKLDVVSENTFIDVGKEVKVIKVEGNRIIVKKLD